MPEVRRHQGRAAAQPHRQDPQEGSAQAVLGGPRSHNGLRVDSVGSCSANQLGGWLFSAGSATSGVSGLFGGGPSAACSAEATVWWLPVLADPPSGDGGGWCRLTEPSHSCWEASPARR